MSVSPTPRSPARVLAYPVIMVLLVLAYHQLVHHSVSGNPGAIAAVVQQYCKSAIASQYAGPEAAREAALQAMAAEWTQCADIRIESIAASGGIINPVVVRVVLDSNHYLPLGKPVLVFKAIDYAIPFLGSLARLATGQWSFNSHTVYSDLTYYGAI